MNSDYPVGLAILILFLGGMFVLITGLLTIFSDGYVRWWKQVYESFGARYTADPVKNVKARNFGGIMQIILGIFLLSGAFFVLTLASKI